MRPTTDDKLRARLLAARARATMAGNMLAADRLGDAGVLLGKGRAGQARRKIEHAETALGIGPTP